MGVKSIKTSLSKNKNQCSNHQIFKQIFTGYAGPKLTDRGVRKNKLSVYITVYQQKPCPCILLRM
jgi:hypothetical protein